MRPLPRIPGVVLLLLLAMSMLLPGSDAICPDDWGQCVKGGLAQQATFRVNPMGVVTLDILNATVDANRSLVAPPGAMGTVTVELLHPSDEENGTANVTITVAATAAVNWTTNQSRSVSNLTGFHNETFSFALGAVLGQATLFVNVSSGGVLAPMALGFVVANTTSSSPPPVVVPPPTVPPAPPPGSVPGLPEALVVAVAALVGLALARRRAPPTRDV